VERPGLDEHAPAPLPHRLLARREARRHDGARGDRRARRRLQAARDPGRGRLLRDGGPLAQMTRGLLVVSAAALAVSLPAFASGALAAGRPPRTRAKAEA